MIPTIIHQVWIGPKYRPEQWMDTWKNSGFEYKLWTEENIQQLSFENKDKYDYYYTNKRYDCAVDILRVEILKKFGGLYIDADTERTKDFPIEWLNCDFTAVEVRSSVITNTVIGCSENSTIIKEYSRAISQVKTLDPCMEKVGALLLTDVIANSQSTEVTNILPAYTFFPKNWRNKVNERASESIATHHYGSTYSKYNERH